MYQITEMTYFISRNGGIRNYTKEYGEAITPELRTGFHLTP